VPESKVQVDALESLKTMKTLLLFLCCGIASANTLADVTVGQYRITNYIITDGVDPSLLVWSYWNASADAAILSFIGINEPLNVSFTVTMVPPDSMHPISALHAQMENLALPGTVTVSTPNVSFGIDGTSRTLSGDLRVSTVIPEPATYWLMGAAVVVLAIKRQSITASLRPLPQFRAGPIR